MNMLYIQHVYMSMCTGIVQLLIDHAHLVGLAPPDLLNHAHQLAEEGVLTSRSNDSLEGVLLDEIKGEAKRDKQRRGSVTGEAKYSNSGA